MECHRLVWKRFPEVEDVGCTFSPQLKYRVSIPIPNCPCDDDDDDACELVLKIIF